MRILAKKCPRQGDWVYLGSLASASWKSHHSEKKARRILGNAPTHSNDSLGSC